MVVDYIGNGSFSLKDSMHFEKHNTMESSKWLFLIFIMPWSSKYEVRKIKSGDVRKASLLNTTFSLYTISLTTKKRIEIKQSRKKGLFEGPMV